MPETSRGQLRSIAVVGVGAIGGWLAGRLVQAGNEVSVVARGPTLEALSRDGLRLSEAGETIAVPVQAVANPASIWRQDLVVIAVKAPAFAEAAESARPLIGPDTLILPMLNGVPWWFMKNPLRSVDPDGRIAAALPLDQIVGCVVHASAFRTAPNAVSVIHADRLILGERSGGTSNRVASLCALFGGGIRVEQSDNIRRAIWYKLWGNATVNPLSALTRATADKLLADGTIRSLMADAMDELAAIGEAIGCPISETAEDRMAVTARLGAFKSSMLQDVEAGRPIELEALLGAPLEIAARAGISTPQLQKIYAMTRLLSDSLDLGR